MNELQPLIDLLAGKYGWFTTAWAWLTTVGFVVKLFSGKLQKRLTEIIAEAAANDDQDDDVIWEALLNNRAYKVLAYVLDFFLRVKLPHIHDFRAIKQNYENQTKPVPTPGPAGPANGVQ